jgi:hypothetical protein
MIIASSDADQVHHMSSAGDLNSGKAWRAVRRPSDMVSSNDILIFTLADAVVRMSTRNRFGNSELKNEPERLTGSCSSKSRP